MLVTVLLDFVILHHTGTSLQRPPANCWRAFRLNAEPVLRRIADLFKIWFLSRTAAHSSQKQSNSSASLSSISSFHFSFSCLLVELMTRLAKSSKRWQEKLKGMDEQLDKPVEEFDSSLESVLQFGRNALTHTSYLPLLSFDRLIGLVVELRSRCWLALQHSYRFCSTRAHLITWNYRKKSEWHYWATIPVHHLSRNRKVQRS